MEKENEVKKYCAQINDIILEISKASNQTNINDLSKLVADFNRELNYLLVRYHEDAELQGKLKPHVMFYRQLFEEFMALVSADLIDDERLELIQEIIKKREDLINGYFKDQAEKELKTIGKVSKELDKCLKKRLEMQEMLKKQKKNDYYS